MEGLDWKDINETRLEVFMESFWFITNLGHIFLVLAFTYISYDNIVQ